MRKKIYVQVALLTGRTYIGYVFDDFSPNYNDDISFMLHDTHFFYTKQSKVGEPSLELVSIEETPEGLQQDMEIMWQSVATVQYMREDSQVVRNIENRGANRKETKKTKGNLVVLANKNTSNP